MITKEDVLEYWGRKACGKNEEGQSIWKSEQFKSKLTEMRYKVSQSENPQDFIDFANYLISIKKLHPFEYAEQLQDLPPLEDFKGCTLKHMNHPLWDKCEEKVIREYKPKSDTMVIASCSNLKPYLDNPNYKFLMKRQNEGYCDVFINAVMLWPVMNSDWLYARVYDALECDDNNPEYNEASISTKYRRVVHYLEEFHYKKLIVWMKPDLVVNKLNEMYGRYCKEHDIEFHVMLSDDMEDLLLKKFKNEGLVHLRHWYQPELQHKFDMIINHPDPTSLKTEEEIRLEATERAWKKKQRKARESFVGFDFSKKK